MPDLSFRQTLSTFPGTAPRLLGKWKVWLVIIGDPSSFAIESEIAEVLSSNSQLALGFFVIHLGGTAFGVRKPDASLLGCSFHEVIDRLARRGTHCIPALDDIEARLVVDAYLDAIYRQSSRADYFGLSREEFIDALSRPAVSWAPDGDEAFDDGSHVLQMNVGNKVRLIAFVHADGGNAALLSEKWLEAGSFYEVLSRWSARFVAERAGRLEQIQTTPT